MISSFYDKPKLSLVSNCLENFSCDCTTEIQYISFIRSDLGLNDNYSHLLPFKPLLFDILQSPVFDASSCESPDSQILLYIKHTADILRSVQALSLYDGLLCFINASNRIELCEPYLFGISNIKLYENDINRLNNIESKEYMKNLVNLLLYNRTVLNESISSLISVLILPSNDVLSPDTEETYQNAQKFIYGFPNILSTISDNINNFYKLFISVALKKRMKMADPAAYSALEIINYHAHFFQSEAPISIFLDQISYSELIASPAQTYLTRINNFFNEEIVRKRLHYDEATEAFASLMKEIRSPLQILLSNFNSLRNRFGRLARLKILSGLCDMDDLIKRFSNSFENNQTDEKNIENKIKDFKFTFSLSDLQLYQSILQEFCSRNTIFSRLRRLVNASQDPNCIPTASAYQSIDLTLRESAFTCSHPFKSNAELSIQFDLADDKILDIFANGIQPWVNFMFASVARGQRIPDESQNLFHKIESTLPVENQLPSAPFHKERLMLVWMEHIISLAVISAEVLLTTLEYPIYAFPVNDLMKQFLNSEDNLQEVKARLKEESEDLRELIDSNLGMMLELWDYAHAKVSLWESSNITEILHSSSWEDSSEGNTKSDFDTTAAAPAYKTMSKFVSISLDIFTRFSHFGVLSLAPFSPVIHSSLSINPFISSSYDPESRMDKVNSILNFRQNIFTNVPDIYEKKRYDETYDDYGDNQNPDSEIPGTKPSLNIKNLFGWFFVFIFVVLTISTLFIFNKRQLKISNNMYLITLCEPETSYNVSNSEGREQQKKERTISNCIRSVCNQLMSIWNGPFQMNAIRTRESHLLQTSMSNVCIQEKEKDDLVD